MLWMDEELEVMSHALDLVGDAIASTSGEYSSDFDQAHTSLSLRISEEQVRREMLRRWK